MVIHFFTKGDMNMASSRARAHLLAQALQRFQVDTVIHTPPVVAISQTPWPKKWCLITAILRALRQVKRGDILFLQRTIYNKYFLLIIVAYICLWRRRMIFDFDDAIYLHSPGKTKFLTWLADAVIVGNHTLLAWAKQYAKNVFLIPSCTVFAPAPTKTFFQAGGATPFTIGWAGNGPVHYENLQMFRPVLDELSARSVACTLVLVGVLRSESVRQLFANPPRGTTVEFHDWVAPDQIPELMKRFDVGIMPLIDTPWNRGKSALKAVEYMGFGIPTLASPVGENNWLIQDGVNGFLPNTTQSWAEAIEKLYRQPEALSIWGARARQTVEAGYSFEAQIEPLLHILNIFNS